MKKHVSTAAYLAGVTTLAVSLPMMASARANGPDLIGSKVETAKSDLVQVDRDTNDAG